MVDRIQSVSHFQASDMPLSIARIQEQDELGLHAHSFTELVIVQAGCGVHFTEYEEYPIHAGETFVIHGDTKHGYRDTEGLVIVNVLFDPVQLQIPLNDLRVLSGYHVLFELEPRLRRQGQLRGHMKLSPEAMIRAEQNVVEIEREIQARQGAYRFLATAELMRLIGFICRCYDAQPKRQQGHTDLMRIGNVLSYLENHFSSPVTLASLVRMSHMSESNLLRAFRKAMGMSPIDYLIRLRVRKAADVLAREDRTITEIAFETGFADSNYLARQFRRVTGLTPTDYRRQVRQMRFET